MPSRDEHICRRRRLAVWLGTGLLTSVCPGPACAQETALEAEVKAAYVDKLPQFVQWPASALASGAFVLCVVGESASEELVSQAVAGHSVQQRPIVVRHLGAITAHSGCQMLFIAGEPASTVVRVLAILRGRPVLTITDQETEPDAIGIINFVAVDGRVRFQINRADASRSGLRISSKLLSVAAAIVQ